ncbi:DUF1858 domain-containing protein [Roseovarius sp. EL26]|uniref:DUF1858 domain-containing protein n=1 Tax=Roseovarius sp. EL26 TaxID=2126672 RepID=UPI000EA0BD4E|nr:DUF1858 domain-containing protein [Roseovarius sp. EL26]
MLLCDIMERWPQTIPVFIRHKMLCVGCAISPYHTIQDACLEHRVSETMFREELGQAINTH